MARTFKALSAAVALVLIAACAAPVVALAGQVGVTVQIKGSGKTEVVEGSIEDGAGKVCDWNSNKDERATNSCARIRNEEALEAWVWLRATPSSTPSGHWSFKEWVGCDETRVKDGHTECAVHSLAFGNVEKSPRAVFDDTVAPTVSSLAATFSTTTEKTVIYTFSLNEGSAQCRFDNSGGFSSCSSGVSRTYASEGERTIEVRAVDPSEQFGAIESQTVKVLDTAIGVGPAAGSTTGPTVEFSFASVAGTGFQCSLDGSAFTDCNSGTRQYTGLPNGQRTFRVRSTEGQWFDRIPATRTWHVDAQPPETIITTGSPDTPAEDEVRTSSSAGFGFGSNENASFECSLDGAAFAACTSPRQLTGLGLGPHEFKIRAKDQVGNVDPTPATRKWTVALADDDGDGSLADVDCDEGDPDVHPGATDVPGNGVDEDCSGGDAAVVTPPTSGGGSRPPVVPIDLLPPPRIQLKAQGLRQAVAKGRLTLAVTSDRACSLQVMARLGAKVVGKARKAVPAGSSKVALKLTAKGRDAIETKLARSPVAKVSLLASCADPAGATASWAKALRLRS